MFNPLMLILTTVMDSLLLGTNIYLGSVLGTMLIIVGLYTFLWGKGKELRISLPPPPPLRSRPVVRRRRGSRVAMTWPSLGGFLASMVGLQICPSTMNV
ncbi:hypothetical protein BAE44_0013837 [Dichanthelium oligosanthes]|uniref:WAT1-related protein n=1 Tax=Dichanthelium oligosanthes TaxID=888268 RepID=A0A1E5VJ25_9POAL|nr:hypothetical protein BAE44_0013837 [Dichanthelium oligosanthes]